MKKLFLGLMATVAFTGCLSASFAADIQMPPSALSNVFPNNQKVVAVAEFSDARNLFGTNAQTMTIEMLTSNRPTIKSMESDGGVKLCVVKSVSLPERVSGGICVSAQNNPSTVTVATFNLGMGAPVNERTMLRKDFDVAKMDVPAGGVGRMDCELKNGGNTHICRFAESAPQKLTRNMQ